MIKRRRTFIVAAVAAMILNVALCFGMFAAANDEVTLADNDYKLAESVDVRLSYDGEGVLDEAKNGLRIKATVSERHYAALKALNENAVVKYGILVAPASYAAENALTYENVFGENRVYATSATQAEEDKENGKTTKIIDCAETENLLKGGDGYYYAFLSLSDLDNASLTGEYVAKAYIVSYALNEYGMVLDPEYVFVDGEKTVNAVYAVQKAIEENRAGDYATDLSAAYIDGKTQSVTVKYTTSYDGANPVVTEKELAFNIGETVTTESVIAKLADFDASAYDLTSGIEPTKIYAGVSSTLELNFSTKKAASVVPAIGFYAADGGATVKITESSLTSGDAFANASYSLFSDGTIVVDDDGEKIIFGTFDATKKQIAVEGLTLNQVLELEDKYYNDVAGMYTYDGKLVRINSDGTADFDLIGNKTTVKYLLAYDEINGRFIAAFGNSVVKTVGFSDGNIEDFEPVSIGKEADYENIANYYSCVTAGDNLDKVYRFNIDGTIVEGGVSVGSFMILKDGTIKAGINGVAYTAEMTKTDYNFGLTIKTLKLKNSSDEVVMTLRNEYTPDYDNIYEVANNLFGYSGSGEERVFVGPTDMTNGAGKPKLTLTAESSKIDALREEAESGGNPWKHADYGTTGWGNVLSQYGHYLSYWIEPLTPATGIVHFKVNNISDQAETATKDVKYGIDSLYQMHIDMTDFDPHGIGPAGQFQVCVADISVKTYGSYTDSKNVYNLFASENGTYYVYTAYRADGADSSVGSFRLYNYHTEIESLKDEYYVCEYWGTKDAYIQSGFERDKIAYKIDYDYSKNVGKLTMLRDGYEYVYTIGIVNGNRFIDMRTPSIAGYSPFDNLKVTDNSRAASDYAAIEYAISTANKTFVNAATPAGTTEEDTRTIYEKIAGTYKTGKYYGETSAWWWGIGVVLNADGTMYATCAADQTGTYTINEITDTFGEILIDCPYPIVSGNVGYYALIDGYYVVRLTNTAMLTEKWSFWDFTPDGCTFSTWNVFDAITGEGTTYTDGNATLTLSGVGTKPNTDNKEYYTGAAFTLTDGDVTVSGRYDFVPTAVGEGKLFINIPSEADEAKRYIIGDYKLIGDNYVLAFTVNDKSYLMSVGSLDGVYAQVTGSYFGVENIEFTSAAEISFASLTSGTITENGITANFVIEGDRVTLTYVKDGLDIIVIK